MRVYNSYSAEMFNARDMLKVVAHFVRVMPGLMKEYNFDTIVVTGKSGTALGFAVAMLVPGLHIVHVRKGESSHGDMIEGGGNYFTRYAFFDDFIASGETKNRVHKELAKHCEGRLWDTPACVLNIAYGMGDDTSYVTKTYVSGNPEPYYRAACRTYLPDVSVDLFHFKEAA